MENKSVQPSVYVTLQSDESRKNYEYPLLELVDILEKFKFQTWSKRDVDQTIENFLHSLAHRNNITAEEYNLLSIKAEMGQWMNDGTFYKCPSSEVFLIIDNLFTGCLLYEYVPLFVLGDYSDWEYKDGTIIKSNGRSYYIIKNEK
jgi:hypothetical protein